jgi:hypothetical protein
MTKHDREQKTMRARELSDRITKRTIGVGVTEQELNIKTLRTFLNIKKTRRTDY